MCEYVVAQRVRSEAAGMRQAGRQTAGGAACRGLARQRGQLGVAILRLISAAWRGGGQRQVAEPAGGVYIYSGRRHVHI